ncbi:hypothetical protein [Cellulomonas shaoxiangyii]|uniref:Uncharacterized protein n=1 Tax=Cellulomonas shaoxiangyii TaxID=2566013 RepID=A0A4P7SG82_9CELL|nr:hypothetical protein [Cellulomonas shaoxiangyii]QCB92631.1 hypothetical protein E5225_02745 [Cellulomonas shaoxiangyii]TGY85439.1 hypothetical protein E5226_06380 [Cellulomonas shaoxiangyii]
MGGIAEDVRPPLARLAERVVLQERDAYGKLFAAASAAAEGAGSGLWAVDQQRAAGIDGAVAALSWASDHVQRWSFSVRDHADTLLLLLRHQKLLPVPAWTVSRAIMEAVLQTCWLLDAEASSETRIARAASILPAVLNESIVLLERFGSSVVDELEEKRQARADLECVLTQDGFRVERATDKHGQVTDAIGRVWFAGQSASTRNNITQLAAKYVPDDPWLYGLFSGAAHAKPWLLMGLSDDVDEAIRSLVLPLLPISDAYSRALCGYFDLDAEPYVRARRTRLVAMVERGSSVRTIDRSIEESAFGTKMSGLRYYELGRTEKR